MAFVLVFPWPQLYHGSRTRPVPQQRLRRADDNDDAQDAGEILRESYNFSGLEQVVKKEEIYCQKSEYQHRVNQLSHTYPHLNAKDISTIVKAFRITSISTI